MSRETEGAVKNNKFSLYKKKLKYGSIATVITVVFIVFVIVINLIAGILTERTSSLTLQRKSIMKFPIKQQII